MQTASSAQEIEQVRTNVGYWAINDWGVLELQGPDAQAFLQNQTTNDVNALAIGGSQPNALLDRKAHVMAYFTLYRFSETGFWLLMQRAHIAKTIERLETYHFAESLEMTDRSADWALFAIQGPKSNGVLLIITAEPAVTSVSLSLTGESGWVLVVPKARQSDVAKSLSSIAMISPQAAEILRIEAGIPLFGRDFGPEQILPSTGLENTAVSYTKGCYQGQEVVAKVKTYGSVGLGLVGLILPPNTPQLVFNADCVINGKTEGTYKSSAHSPTLQRLIVMAYLSRDYRVPGQTVSLEIQGQSVTAEVTLLPFYQPKTFAERAQAYYETALAAFADDREMEAIALLRDALALNPELMDAYEALGVILSRQNEYDEAISLMQTLAKLAPEEVMPHTNLSIFYMKQGKKEEAETEKAIATTLTFKKAFANKQTNTVDAEAAQRRAELQQKAAMFLDVLEIDSEDALANYGLGNTYVELGQYAQAAPLLEKAIALNERHTVAYLALGKAYEALQESEKAKAIYQSGIEMAAKRGDLMPLQEMQRRLGGGFR